MNARALMVASSAFLAALGFAATFVPAEMLSTLGVESVAVLLVVVQLLGALYFPFATCNQNSIAVNFSPRRR